ncbi:MAG: hypothetical protein P8J20_13855 [Novosphingobium sp.]|nr:hypothetical protein [Novosphingobium sp.]
MSEGKPRVELRTKALIKACLRDGGAEREACVLDVSTRGILATTARPPTRGEFVELMVGRQMLVGQVKWASQRRFGIVLRERISVAALIAGDSGSVALMHAQSARKRSGSIFEALTENSRNLGQLVQFAIMVAILGVGAYFLADYAGSGLGSLQDAKVAMSGKESG